MFSVCRLPRSGSWALLLLGATLLLPACGSDSAPGGGKSCAVDTNCEATQYCKLPLTSGDGECVEGCRTSSDQCASGTHCDAVSRDCIANGEEGEGEGTEGEGEGEGVAEGEGEGIAEGEGEGEGVAEGEGEGEGVEGEGEGEGAGCGGDAECSATEFCSAQGECLAGCRLDPDNCAEGEHCEANGAQQSCVEDLPPPCDGPEDCAENERCDTDLGECVPDVPLCEDDDQSPNASREEAAPLAGPFADLQLGSLMLCPGTEDWFTFPGTAGATLTLTLTSDVAGLEAELYQDQALQGSTVGQAGRSVTVAAAVAGSYFIRIFGGVEGTYALGLQMNGGGGECEADGNGTLATATPLSAGRLPGMQLCVGDVDFYRIDVTAVSELFAVATFVGASGSLVLQLQDATGQLVGNASVSSHANDTVLRVSRDETLTAGAYYLRVSGPQAQAATLDYALATWVDAFTAGQCTPDHLEANNTRETAQAVQVPTVEAGLRICGPVGEEDWYSVPVQQGVPLSIRIDFFHNWGDIDLVLYCGEPAVYVAASEGTSNVEEILDYQPEASGTCLLKVKGVVNRVDDDYLLWIW